MDTLRKTSLGLLLATCIATVALAEEGVVAKVPDTAVSEGKPKVTRKKSRSRLNTGELAGPECRQVVFHNPPRPTDATTCVLGRTTYLIDPATRRVVSVLSKAPDLTHF